MWNLFLEFKISRRLLTVKLDGEHEPRYALLTFRKSTDVDKAMKFCTNKMINNVRIKAEPYDGTIIGKSSSKPILEFFKLTFSSDNNDCDLVKRPICTDPDNDEYSLKATRTLYIGNLQSEISYNELREAYSAYGDIIVCIFSVGEDNSGERCFV